MTGVSAFAPKHDPVEGELLFYIGYSGERSRMFLDTLITRGTPYITQECEFPSERDDADSEYHFSLFYKSENALSVDLNAHPPDPHGLSGSLVWDTKRVACLREKIKWFPQMAKVTGIIWGWPSSDACVLATKSEHFSLTDITKSEQMHNNGLHEDN